MIQSSTRLKVLDNSGALIVECIKVLGGSQRKVSGIGDVIVSAVKRSKPRKKVKKGEVRRGVIVLSTKSHSDFSGNTTLFGKNCLIMYSQQSQPLGNRIKGPLSIFIRNKGHYKLSMSTQAIC